MYENPNQVNIQSNPPKQNYDFTKPHHDYGSICFSSSSGQDPQTQTSNWPRECIRQFFPRRKCFVFDWPVSDPQLLAKIESISESQLNPNFQKQLENFCSYIFSHATGKRLGEGILVTGSRESLLQSLYLLWVSIRQSLGSWLELSEVIFAIQECGNAEVCVISGNPLFFNECLST